MARGDVPAVAARPRERLWWRLLGGMVATPWFAVSAGLMVAAWMALSSAPAAQLTFPGGPQAECRVDNCGNTSPGVGTGPGKTGPGGVAGTGVRQRQATQPGSLGGSLAGATAVSTAPAHVQARYSVERSGDHFIAVFVLTTRHDMGDWALRLTLPGAQINMVMGAKWTPLGGGAGVVSGSPPPWQESGSRSTRFVIFGTVWQGPPGDCVFDGGPCSFSLMSER